MMQIDEDVKEIVENYINNRIKNMDDSQIFLQEFFEFEIELEKIPPVLMLLKKQKLLTSKKLLYDKLLDEWIDLDFQIHDLNNMDEPHIKVLYFPIIDYSKIEDQPEILLKDVADRKDIFDCPGLLTKY